MHLASGEKINNSCRSLADKRVKNIAMSLGDLLVKVYISRIFEEGFQWFFRLVLASGNILHAIDPSKQKSHLITPWTLRIRIVYIAFPTEFIGHYPSRFSSTILWVKKKVSLPSQKVFFWHRGRFSQSLLPKEFAMRDFKKMTGCENLSSVSMF